MGTCWLPCFHVTCTVKPCSAQSLGERAERMLGELEPKLVLWSFTEDNMLLLLRSSWHSEELLLALFVQRGPSADAIKKA